MSQLNVNNVAPASGGTETDLYRGLAKAWASYDGTGTAAILDSLNVSSLVDVGAGLHSLNWTNNFSNALYAENATAGSDGSAGGNIISGAPWSTSSVSNSGNITTLTIAGVAGDMDKVTLVAHGDLA
jgi:hypothetical protein